MISCMQKYRRPLLESAYWCPWSLLLVTFPHPGHQFIESGDHRDVTRLCQPGDSRAIPFLTFHGEETMPSVCSRMQQ